ncbi:MAG TPA: hypothetical protein VEY30_07405 [Myxococcaceae bacterium]|nr:hypothetical protein [Myxococcaceae bacterium]
MNPFAQGIPLERPDHAPAPAMKVPAELVCSWPVGTFVENLVALTDGGLIVSVLSERELVRIDPGRPPQTFARLPDSPTGLSQVGRDLFVNVGEPGKGGWSIHRVGPDGGSEKALDVPEAYFLNGSTPFQRNSLLVVDAALGRVFLVNTRTRTHTLWLEHPLLGKASSEPMLPGVNGVKLFRGNVYFTSTDRALVLRVSVKADGTPGAVETLADRFVGDDFAFDVDGNMYVATHVHNQLQRLGPTGERVVLAGPEEGMNGSTAVAFGRGPTNQRSLYVTTTGGIFAPLDGRVREAKVVRLDVGVEGAAVAGD